jgi:branched-chain amino acid transport system substrate-binding protein
MQKSAHALSLSVAAILTLVACGGASGNSAKTATGSNGKTTGPAVLKLAYLGAMTGDLANVGGGARDAIQLAIDKANDRGDLGVRLTLEVFDTQADPAQAPQLATRAVIDGGVLGVVGPMTSGEVKAAAPIFDEAGLPFVTVATNPDLARHGWKTFHRLVANDDTQASEMATYIEVGLKATTVSLIHDNTEYGRGLTELIGSALRQRGVATAIDAIDPKALDYSAAVNTVKARRPAAVFYGGYYPEAGRLVKQLRDAGLAAPFLSGDAAKDPALAQSAGSAAEGAVVSCPCSDLGQPPDRAAPAFAGAYQHRFGRPPPLYSAEAYDGAGLLIDAVRRGAHTRDSVLANLKTAHVEGVTKTFSFRPDGEVGAGPIYLYQFRHGRFASLGTTAGLTP